MNLDQLADAAYLAEQHSELVKFLKHIEDHEKSKGAGARLFTVHVCGEDKGLPGDIEELDEFQPTIVTTMKSLARARLKAVDDELRELGVTVQ